MTTDANDAPASFLLRYQRKIALAAAAWLAFMQAHSAEPDAVERELENVMMAAQQALAEPTAYAAGLTLVMEAWRHMELRGHWLLWQDILRAAVAVATEMKAASHTARLHDQLAETERLLGNNAAALAQFEAALQLALSSQDYRLAVRILAHASQSHMMLGQLDVAEKYCYRASTIGKGLVEANDLGLVHNNWGIICQENQDFDQALVHFAQAAQYFDQAQNRRGLANVANNRGEVYHRLQRHVEAEIYFNEALAAYRTLGDMWYEAIALNNLSVALFKQEKLAKALALNLDCEARARRLHSTYLLARLYNNRGIFLAKQGTLYEAKGMFEESVTLHLKNGNQIYAADTLQNYAEALLDAGDNTEAEHALIRARTLIKQLSIIPPVWLINDDIYLTTRLANTSRITETQPLR